MEYTLVVLLILIICIFTDFILKTSIFKQWKILILTFFLGVLVTVPWDIFAIVRGHWWIGQTIGLNIWVLPVEELIAMMNMLLIPVIAWEYFRNRKN